MHPSSIIYMLPFILSAGAFPLGHNNLPQAEQGDRLTLRTAHVDSTRLRSISNPAVSIEERSRIDKHDPNDLDASKQSDNTIRFGISFMDEPRISKRGPHDANDPIYLTSPPEVGLSSSDEPNIMQRSPDEGDDDQENGQDDSHETPPNPDDEPEARPVRLIGFGDAPPRHHRWGV